MRNRRLFPLTLLLCCGAALAEPVAEPTAAVHLGPARPSAGLDIRTQVDRARALPDDTLTYTVT
ncbi:MAG: hypothetical protein HUU35_03025, partial [Armatimonadetes bacterium]|nr:hypothetical protein [Armatimonadota bacterium]